MKLRANSIRNGIVVASIALASIISGCKPESEPKRECVDQKGAIVECPWSMISGRDAMTCVKSDGSIVLDSGKVFKSGELPTGIGFNATTEFVTPELASIEMTEPLSKVKGYTKVPVCEEEKPAPNVESKPRPKLVCRDEHDQKTECPVELDLTADFIKCMAPSGNFHSKSGHIIVPTEGLNIDGVRFKVSEMARDLFSVIMETRWGTKTEITVPACQKK